MYPINVTAEVIHQTLYQEKCPPSFLLIEIYYKMGMYVSHFLMYFFNSYES